MTELENYQRILELHGVKDGERVSGCCTYSGVPMLGKVIGCSSIVDGNNYLILEISENNTSHNYGWDWRDSKDKYSPNVKISGLYWWADNISKV